MKLCRIHDAGRRAPCIAPTLEYTLHLAPIGYNPIVATQSVPQSPPDTFRFARSPEIRSMKMPSAIRATVLAFAALAGVALSSAAHADEGFVQLTIYKAGWIIGGSGGGGVLNFHGRRYPLSTGGLDYGLVFGGSTTVLRARVSTVCRPSDAARVCEAHAAGIAVGGAARVGVLTKR